ncbi:MAG: 23S rRNA (uracil(1939)-C(5))-methyltransferase RlmD [Bacteroidota bacterium]
MKGKVLEKLEIVDIADNGKSIARHNGLVIFIEKALPGDIVDVQITRKKSSYLEGRATFTHKYSEFRTTPFCKHFGICGGCKWQDMNYESQLFFKQKQVTDAMVRLGRLDIPVVLPIIASDTIMHYRNKLDYSCSDKKWLSRDDFADVENTKGPALGYHIAGRFDMVLDVKECFLQPEPSNSIRNAIKAYADEHHLTFINLRNRQGLLRSLIIRNTLKGEWMVIVMVYENNQEQLNGLLQHLADSFPEIISLLYIINQKGNDTFHDLDVNVFKGRDYILEEMDGLQFRIGAKSFFQTNPSQTLKLYKAARELADLTGEETVYDLYTGTGTIANFIARYCKKVIGIEYVPEAIEDAKINSDLNNITNTEYYAGDMRELLTAELFNKHGFPDVIITDPPRAGMHFDVVDCLLKSGCPRIVYISCNPATQARDIGLLAELYKVEKLQPVDMFPHTAHVENIALLVLK